MPGLLLIISSTQSRLATLLSSLIACQRVGHQTLDGSDLKTYLKTRGFEPDVASIAGPTRVWL